MRRKNWDKGDVHRTFLQFCAESWVRERVYFQWDDDEIRFVIDQHAEVDFIVLAHWNNTPRIAMSPLSDILFWFWEATNTKFTVFGLTRPGLEPTIYRTWGEHVNHYTTDAIFAPNTLNFIF